MELLVDKYRPKTLKSVIGNSETIEIISNIIKNKGMPHLLFTGPPGTGKTTCARILSQSLAGGKNDVILELNASDDRGIEVVRTKIKFFAQKMVEKDTFKIIILDEADSMTTAAQQAMRRLMEIYSGNTRFILICNTFSKIFEPIQSRCAVLRFERLAETEIRSELTRICEIEKINLDSAALKAIISFSDGDMRQCLNILQSVSGIENITEDVVEKIFGQPSPMIIERILKGLEDGDVEKSLKIFDDMWAEKYEPNDIINSFFRVARRTDNYELMKNIGILQLKVSEGNDSKLQFYGMLYDIVKKN